VSPDEREVAALIRRGSRRGRIVATAEALAWGAVVAVVSPVAAVFVAVAIGGWRSRATRDAAVVRALERTHPDARNLFVTAAELASGRLAAKPAARDRVFARAAVLARSTDLSRTFPARSMVVAIVVAMVAWAGAATTRLWRPAVAGIAAGIVRTANRSDTPSVSAAVHVSATIEPPAYTRRSATTVVDPPQIAALEGSTLTLDIQTEAASATLEHDGETRPLARDARGHFVHRLALRRTGFVAIAADSGGRRLVPIVVSADALPAVRVTAPNRDLVFADANQRVAFEVRATDDFGLRSLSLQYTKVSGSGEQFEFQDGEIPLSLVRASDRDWQGTAARSLTALDLKEGDTLVYRAAAADARPGGGTAISDAFFIEISRLGVAAGDAFTLPEQETRYALSQQMLIIKTEKLNARRATMKPADVQEEALNLAVEQRMIRAEFVFMLGGEVEDEEVEAEQSTELQAGRLENRGQRDVRAATIAMSEAGKLLTGADTAGALKAERAAVAALQRAFSRDRYILRALATRTELDPQRRLTGNVSQAVNWRREPPASQANRRAALLQDLLTRVGALRQAPAGAAADVNALAREALAIDPESAALRAVAADFQRLADTWSSSVSDVRRSKIDAIGGAIATETTRTLATASMLPNTVAAPLAGAFADALRRRGTR
jgi:hypothetical protein